MSSRAKPYILFDLLLRLILITLFLLVKHLQITAMITNNNIGYHGIISQNACWADPDQTASSEVSFFFCYSGKHFVHYSPDNNCVSRFEVTPVFLLFNDFNPY